MLQSLDGAFYRRLAVTAAALAAYRLGTQLPVPGLVHRDRRRGIQTR